MLPGISAYRQPSRIGFGMLAADDLYAGDQPDLDGIGDVSMPTPPEPTGISTVDAAKDRLYQEMHARYEDAATTKANLAVLSNRLAELEQEARGMPPGARSALQADASAICARVFATRAAWHQRRAEAGNRIHMATLRVKAEANGVKQVIQGLGRWGGGFSKVFQNINQQVQSGTKKIVTGKLQMKDALMITAFGPGSPIIKGIGQSIRAKRSRGGQDADYVAYHVLVLKSSETNGFIEFWMDAIGNEITQTSFDQLALNGPTTSYYYDENANELSQPEWQARLDIWARGKQPLPPTFPPMPVKQPWQRVWQDYRGNKIRVAFRAGDPLSFAQSDSFAMTTNGNPNEIYARPYFNNEKGPAFGGQSAIMDARTWIDQRIASAVPVTPAGPIDYNGGRIYQQRQNATAVLGAKRSPMFVPGWGEDVVTQAKAWIDAEVAAAAQPPPVIAPPAPTIPGYDPLAVIRSGKSYGMQGLGYLGLVNRLRRLASASSGRVVRGSRDGGGKTLTLGPKSGMWY